MEKQKNVILKWSIDTNSVWTQDIRIDITDLVELFENYKKIEKTENENKETKPSQPTKTWKSWTSEIIAVWSQEEITKMLNEQAQKEQQLQEQKQEKFEFDYSKFSYSWNLENEPFKEIIAFQNGKIYLSYEWFSYFFIMCLVWIFVFRMFIKLCILSYNLWFNYFLIWKK